MGEQVAASLVQFGFVGVFAYFTITLINRYQKSADDNAQQVRDIVTTSSSSLTAMAENVAGQTEAIRALTANITALCNRLEEK